MRKLWNGILTLLLLCCFCSVALAHSEKLEAPRLVKVGFYKYKGYNEIDDGGFKRGYGYDFLQMLAGYGNFAYEYAGYEASWEALENMLATGDIDILVGATRTPERDQRFLFSNNPVGYDAGILTTTMYNKKYVAGDYATFNGMKVALMRGGVQNDMFTEFAELNKIQYTPVYYDNLGQMVDALKNGHEVDAVVTSNAREISDEKVLRTFGSKSTYLMFNRNNISLKEAMDRAMDEMNANNSDWSSDLRLKYFSNNAAFIPMTPAEEECVREHKKQGLKLRVLINPDMRPYSYFENHRAKGIVVDYLDQLARMYGIDLEYIETPNAAASQKTMLTDRPDVVVAAGMRFSYAEALSYYCTGPFMNTSVVLMTKRGTMRPDVKKVAVVRGMHHLETLMAKNYGSDNVRLCRNLDECVEAVKAGEVDGAAMYVYSSLRYLNTDWRNQLQVLEGSRITTSFTMAVPRNSDRHLYSLLCKGIGSIPNETIQSDASKYLADKSEIKEPLWAYAYRNPQIMLFLIVALLCAVLFAQQYRNKAKQFLLEEQRRAELEKVNAELHTAIIKAETDAMTGLLNKMSTQNMITEHLAAGGILFLMDLDNFKSVNDTLGHHTGDQLLIHFSEHLRKVFRATDIVGRIGGDEFLAFIDDEHMTEANLLDKIHAIQKAVVTAKELAYVDISKVTVSVGVLRLKPNKNASFVEAYECVDKELYNAKHRGKNTYVISELK